MSARSIDLKQPLPASVAAGSPRWWLSYRSYPVFSAPWVWRRALFFGLIIVLWGALSSFFHYTQEGHARSAMQLFGYFVVGFMVIVNAGPVLASLVRHRHLQPATERWLVSLAIVIGLGLALAADAWSSGAISQMTGEEAEHEITGWALVINLLVLFAIYAVLGGGLALRAYWSEHGRLAAFESEQAMRGLKSDKLAADRQLAMLQAQVEPHFLFNSLATIRSDIREQPEQAERTLDALCDYLRATIPKLRPDDAGPTSTLGEQLEICSRYLTVMQSRMRGRLEFSVDAEQDLKALSFPPFILLSLVENAIRHGLEQSPQGGRIDIHARRDGQRLEVSVIDTGVGLCADAGSGVGLSNIRHHLKLLHGDAARLKLVGRAEGGVEARIELPVEAAAEEGES